MKKDNLYLMITADKDGVLYASIANHAKVMNKRFFDSFKVAYRLTPNGRTYEQRQEDMIKLARNFRYSLPAAYNELLSEWPIACELPLIFETQARRCGLVKYFRDLGLI